MNLSNFFSEKGESTKIDPHHRFNVLTGDLFGNLKIWNFDLENGKENVLDVEPSVFGVGSGGFGRLSQILQVGKDLLIILDSTIFLCEVHESRVIEVRDRIKDNNVNFYVVHVADSENVLGMCLNGLVIILLNLKTKKVTRVWKAHDEVVDDIQVLSKDRVASASDDGSIKIWKWKDQKCVKHIEKAHKEFGGDYACSLTKMGDNFLISGGMKFIKVWRMDDYSLFKKITVGSTEEYVSRMSPFDHNTIVCGGGEFSWVNIFTGEVLMQKKQDDYVLATQKIDKERVMIYTRGKRIIVWNLRKKEIEKDVKGHEQFMWSMCHMLPVESSEEGIKENMKNEKSFVDVRICFEK